MLLALGPLSYSFLFRRYAPKIEWQGDTFVVSFSPWFNMLLDALFTISSTCFLFLLIPLFLQYRVTPFFQLSLFIAIMCRILYEDSHQKLLIQLDKEKIHWQTRFFFSDFHKSMGNLENLETLVMKGNRAPKGSNTEWLFGAELALHSGEVFQIINPNYGYKYDEARKRLLGLARRLNIPLITSTPEPITPEIE
ncbi:hypothetical protein ACFL35_16760 [Candidatus Riflebacteria bacterium]